jgi:hypothetical protein
MLATHAVLLDVFPFIFMKLFLAQCERWLKARGQFVFIGG